MHVSPALELLANQSSPGSRKAGQLKPAQTQPYPAHSLNSEDCLTSKTVTKTPERLFTETMSITPDPKWCGVSSDSSQGPA